VGVWMVIPMVALAAGCVLLGLLSPLVVGSMGPLLAEVNHRREAQVLAALAPARTSLLMVVAILSGSSILVALLLTLRAALLGRREVRASATWGCGYAAPTARMQYTSSSFSQPLTGLFHFFLRTRRKFAAPEGPFPRESSFATEPVDLFREGLFRPAFLTLGRGLKGLRWLERGRVQLYVLSIALTIVVLLLWKLW
jgi:hydrogenase-4 component B